METGGKRKIPQTFSRTFTLSMTEIYKKWLETWRMINRTQYPFSSLFSGLLFFCLYTGFQNNFLCYSVTDLRALDLEVKSNRTAGFVAERRGKKLTRRCKKQFCFVNALSVTLKMFFFSSLEKRSQSFIRIHSSFTLELPQTCFRMHFGQTPRTLQNEPRVVLKKATQDQECATSCPLMCIPFDSRLCFFPPRLEVTAWLLFISPLTGEALVNSDSLSPVCSSILSQPTQCAALSPEPR